MAEKKATPKGEAKAKPAAKHEKAHAAAEHAPVKAKAASAHKRVKPAPVPQKTTNPYTKLTPRATFMPKPADQVHKWHLVDATGLVLGRAASRIAYVLRGKHKPTYTPHADMGDYVVVINAEKIKLTGSKEEQKPYYHHTMHPGGLKTIRARDVRTRNPERMLEDAIRRMISRNPLGREMVRKLHVYKGPAHPHQAQNPQPFTLP